MFTFIPKLPKYSGATRIEYWKLMKQKGGGIVLYELIYPGRVKELPPTFDWFFAKTFYTEKQETMIDEKNKNFYINFRHKSLVHRIFSEEYSEPSHTPRTWLSAVNYFAKSFILDV